MIYRTHQGLIQKLCEVINFFMKIPKYIDETLKKRTKAAHKLIEYDCVISEYIEKHNIPVDTADYHLGCEMIMNPEESESNIRKAIINHE